MAIDMANYFPVCPGPAPARPGRVGTAAATRSGGPSGDPPLPFRSAGAISTATAPGSCGQSVPNRSNSPFRTPPRNAYHSSGVNDRTGPAESLLLRTPIPPPGRSATSTQLPLEKLRELLTQSEPDPSGALPCVVLPTSLPH